MTNQSSQDPVTGAAVAPNEGSAPAEATPAPPAGETTDGQGAAALMASLEKEKADLLDRLLRKQAELDNFRKRVEREKSEWYHQGLVDLIKEFLPVMDACERALASFRSASESAASVENYRSGVELIYKQFQNIMQKFGVTAIEALGGGFDPYLHEAIARVETEEHEENRVIEELQKGYMHREKLLRPAVVKVSAAPQKSSSAE